MKGSKMPRSIHAAAGVGFALLALALVTSAFAQQRLQYLSGLNATNSGVMPEPGFTYANIFYYDSSSRLKGPNSQGFAS